MRVETLYKVPLLLGAALALALGVSLTEIDRLIDGRPPDLASHGVPEWLTHYESLVQAAGRLSEIEFYLSPVCSRPGTTP